MPRRPRSTPRSWPRTPFSESSTGWEPEWCGTGSAACSAPTGGSRATSSRHRPKGEPGLRSPGSGTVEMIPDELIEQVRDSADIVSLIGEIVSLKKSGADRRGPCPFHRGTHRNFAVIPKKGLYYCYVCHAAGDVFTFLMKRSGL